MDLKKKKKVVIFGIVAIILFIAVSVALYGIRHPQAVEEEASTPDTPVAEETVEPDTALSAEQESLIEGYDAETKELISLLEKNVWLSNGESSTLTFTTNTITESSGSRGEQNEHTYAVSALEKSTSTAQGVNGETTTYTDYDLVLLTEDGTYILKLRKTTASSDEGSDVWNASSTMFAYAKSYTLSQASEALAVSDTNDEFKALLGDAYGQLSDKLGDYCAIYFPTAAYAEWTATATIDWEYRTVTTTFMLDNTTKSQVDVIYEMGSGDFTFD